MDINGDDIRRLRESLGWTRAKLSEESDVPERTIQDIETGKSKNPGLYTIKEILKALPNYPDNRKSDLILDIQSRLTALDYDELDTVSSSIKDLIADRPSKPKATLTE